MTAGRWGLVLGGGGVLGAAWMAGALDAVERTHGLDARTADVILGHLRRLGDGRPARVRSLGRPSCAPASSASR